MKSIVAKKTASVLVKMNIQNGGKRGGGSSIFKEWFFKEPSGLSQQLQHRQQQKMTSRRFNTDTYCITILNIDIIYKATRSLIIAFRPKLDKTEGDCSTLWNPAVQLPWQRVFSVPYSILHFHSFIYIEFIGLKAQVKVKTFKNFTLSTRSFKKLLYRLWIVNIWSGDEHFWFGLVILRVRAKILSGQWIFGLLVMDIWFGSEYLVWYWIFGLDVHIWFGSAYMVW